MELSPKQRFIKALKREPITGLVPTFELVFFLTMEAFGQVHPSQRVFGQWKQMSQHEKDAQIKSIAQCYIKSAEMYGHDAIFVHSTPQDAVPVLRQIRELSGDKYYTMIHGDATSAMPDGEHMLDYSYRLSDEPEKVKEESEQRVNIMLETIYENYVAHNEGLLDGVALCSDYCFNSGPFWSPDQFSEFITPYLAKVIKGYRDMGIYTIKHTDGNIMPIIDQMVECRPDALHSLDPQGGVDLAEVKAKYGDKVTLCGNVNCGLLQTGTDEQVVEDVKRSLSQGMPGGGYIFCTSNCVFTGMELARYELMMDTYRKYGRYE